MAEGQQLLIAIDVGVGRLLKGQLHVEPEGLPRSRPAVSGFHDARASARHHFKAAGHGLSGHIQGERIDRIVFWRPS